MLTWSTTDATSCTASDGWSGAKSSSGNEVVGILEAQHQFTLACTGAGGTVSRTANIGVLGMDPLPETTASSGYLGMIGRSFAFGAGEGVKDIEVDEARRKVYVSVHHHVAVLSADTYLLERFVAVGASAHGMALSADGTRLYVALFQGGSIAVVDTTTFAVRRIEVALQTGAAQVYDVAEVRPGVVLVSAYGSSATTRTAYVVAVKVDDPVSVTQVGDRADGRDGPVFHLTPDRSRASYSYYEKTAGVTRTVTLDTTAQNMPVVSQGPANFRLNDQLEFNRGGDLLMAPGGTVLDPTTYSTLRRGVMGGALAKTGDGSEIGAYGGGVFYLFDGQTLRLKARYQVSGCPQSTTNAMRASGRRGEWIIGTSGSEICVLSTTIDPMSKPGSDGSRQFPAPPVQQDLPIIESHIAGLASAMVVDPARHRAYVAASSPVGIGAVNTDTGVPTDFLPLSGTPISLKLSQDGTRLMAGMQGGAQVVVVDVPGWRVEKQFSLSSTGIQPNIAGFVELNAHAWITTGGNENPTPGMRYPLVLFDPDAPAGARVVADPRGYCAYLPAVSPDRRFLYAPSLDCSLVLEKRDTTTPGWDVVATTDGDQWFSSQGLIEISPDGDRLYTDQGLVYSTTTLRQIGRYQGDGRYLEVPNTSLLIVHSVDTLLVYDRNTLLQVALGGGYCEAYRESRFFASPRLWPDYSRGAVLGGGTIQWPRVLCLIDFRSVVP